MRVIFCIMHDLYSWKCVFFPTVPSERFDPLSLPRKSRFWRRENSKIIHPPVIYVRTRCKSDLGNVTSAILEIAVGILKNFDGTTIFPSKYFQASDICLYSICKFFQGAYHMRCTDTQESTSKLNRIFFLLCTRVTRWSENSNIERGMKGKYQSLAEKKKLAHSCFPQHFQHSDLPSRSSHCSSLCSEY